MKKLNMCINFGFAGFQNGETDQAAYEKIIGLMKEFVSLAEPYNCEKYGFSGEAVRCNIFSADIFGTDAISNMAAENGYRMNIVTSVHGEDSTEIRADAVIALDVKKKNLSYPNIAAEYLVNKSDAVFLLWDGRQNFHEGILWTVLQFCKQKEIPYYLVNTQDLEDVSFSSDPFYVPYTSGNVEGYVKSLFDHEEREPEEKPIVLSGLWLALHNRFTNKYKLKAKNVPYVEDKILSAGYFPEDSANARNHAFLTECFAYYDQKAVKASAMHRAAIYFRSILPFIATIFIAVGFYAETVLGFLLGKPQLFGMNFWVIAASVGFLTHAVINLYAGQTAKNERVARLRKDFVEARFIAEYLRVVIHSEAYGIQINNIWMKETLVDKAVVAKLHHIIRQQETVSCVQNGQMMEEAVGNFEALIADQLAYHENCINRYSLIAQRLSRLSEVMTGVGVAIVILRGFLQFAASYAALPLELHGIKVDSFIKSFANMLALLLPAWASYFTSKLNLNSYAWLRNNSRKMKAGFEDVQKKLGTIRLRRDNSYQVIEEIANEIMNLSQEDYTGWYLRTESQGFTKL